MANESDAANRTEVMAFQVHQDRSFAPPLVQGAEVNRAVGGVLGVQFYIDIRKREVSRSTEPRMARSRANMSLSATSGMTRLHSQWSRMLPPRKSWRGSCYVR